MKRIMVATFAVMAAICASAGIVVREVTFPPDEIPATNPRVERRGDTVTHVEVFAPFTVSDDGSARTLVAECHADMDPVAAGLWIKEARRAVGAAQPRTFSKIRLKIAIARIGKLAALETWLASFEVAPGYSALAAWNDAQVISDDFEGFAAFYAAAKSALGVDDATADALLAACESGN